MIKKILFSFIALGIIFSPAYIFAQNNPLEDVSGETGAEDLQKATDGNIGTGSLIPSCISDPEETRNADASCITKSIIFYINILLVIVAIGAFLYMLYGAFLFATAFGDESKIGQAKKTVTHAIVGVILAGMSVLLVTLLKSLLGVET